ncbi:MFS transporter [Bipolaris maydis]|nr:MFS transporter [Bipolaris maydis]
MAEDKHDAEHALSSDSDTTTDEQQVLAQISEAEEKRLLRKLDLRLLPAVSILYLLSFLDRSNVANARIEGLTKDLKMTGNQYLTGLTLYFVGYVLFEIPCNIVLKRTTPRFWLPTLTVAWGVVATLIGIVQNLTGFLIVRFFLGVTESGLFPGVVYYLSMWYKRNERQYRISLFFSCASLAGAFGGILAYGIAHMRGVAGQPGWRWIFILEGIATVLIGIIAYWFISNYPSTVSWLSPKERTFLQARLKADSDATNDEAFSWDQVILAAKDIKVWLYAFGFHTMSLPLYTLSLFLPTIIKDMGYTSAQSQLLTIPPYALATLFTILIAILSERYAPPGRFHPLHFLLGNHRLHHPTRKHEPARTPRRTFFAAAGIYPSVALVLCWPAINVSGQTKRATANALQISIGNLGAVLGTQLYRANSGPRYVLGHSFALGYLAMNLVVVSALWVVLDRENAEKDKVLESEPHVPGFHDSAEDLALGDRHPRWRFQV